jgi:hypothetical protein
MEEPLLIPGPRHLTRRPGALKVPADGLIRLLPAQGALLRDSGGILAAALAEAGCRGWRVTAGPGRQEGETSIALALDRQAATHNQGYDLEIGPRGIAVTGHDPPGAFYGVCTVRQLLRQYGAEVPCLSIVDYPDFEARGVLLDVSRSKVPTMATLKGLVDFLAGLKANQLQLYFEHTFAYRQHPAAWVDASPLTGEEIRELDGYCRKQHVELVPNQNSFGHLENWLCLPDYLPLAECPDGFTLPWGEPHAGPFSLNPTDPRSLAFLEGLYNELLPHFTSRLFNVGCDETYDVGKGRSRQECEQKGVPRVYLEFLVKIRDLVRERGRTMLFWADMVQEHPGLLAELPSDLVALEWGYEPDHPFGDRCRRIAEAGLPFYVCPNTGTLNAVEGRTDCAVANMESAAEHGLGNSARGYLNTEWGDHGHWQQLPVAYLGFAFGAAMGWDRHSASRDRWTDALSLHAFGDPTGSMGRLAWDLGNVYQVYQRQAGKTLRFSSFLNRVLYELPDQPAGPELEWDRITGRLLGETRERISAATAYLPRSRMRLSGVDGTLIRREFEQTARLMLHACSLAEARLESGHPSPASARALADDLGGILAEHRSLWLARNRIGGLEERSCRYFRELLAAYDRLAQG